MCKRFIYTLLLLLFAANTSSYTKTAVLVIAHRNYQPVEYNDTKRLLEQAGITVITASNKAGTAIGDDGSQTTVDKTVAELKPSMYDGIFFIGGSGALSNLDNNTSYSILKKTAAEGKPFGAICISPRILAKAGVLKGKKATGWNSDNQLAKIFPRYDVEYIRKNVGTVIDGNIITATCPLAAQDFAQGIINLLK
jgi:protease I